MSITEERKKGLSIFISMSQKPYEIAVIERMSIGDIHSIIKEEEARLQNYKRQQQQEEISVKAYRSFSESKKPVDVTIALNLREPEVTKMYREYSRLKWLYKLNLIYKETNRKLSSF